MRYGGYKYDDDTGDFKEIPGAKKKSSAVSWSWHLPRLRMPSFHLPRPRFRMPRLDWKSVWRCLEKPLYYFFYPVVKWWQVELEAVRNREWFMVLLWVLPGLFLLGVYRVVLSLLLGLAGGALTSVRIDDPMTLLLVIGGLVASVVLYAKALAMTRRGQLDVYRDWGDFLKSAAWIVAVPLGLEWGLDTDCDWLMRMAGWALALVGVCCFCG